MPGEFHSTYEDELKRLYFILLFVLLGLLNFTLKKWCTISRGAEPHARKANLEKVLTGTHRSGIFRDRAKRWPEIYHFCILLYHIKQVHPGVPLLSVCVSECVCVCVKVIAKG